MTLIEAKKEASERSKRSGKKVWVILCEDGECILGDVPMKGHIHVFQNGVELPHDKTPIMEVSKPLTPKKEIAAKSTAKKTSVKATTESAAKNKETKTTKKMTTATKVSAKKATPAKKTAPAKKSAPAKKVVAKKDGLPAGKKMMMKVKDIVKYLKEGKGVYRPDNGRRMNLKFNLSLDQTKEREVIFAG